MSRYPRRTKGYELLTNGGLVAYDEVATEADLGGGGVSISQNLKEWTSGEDYEVLTVTYDVTYTATVASATVQWPDGSTGAFTVTTINPTFETIDAYTITHTDSGKTVTQSAVTRNANGFVTNKPVLTVS